jgi:uracil-DNA glycosylase family 4
MSAMDWHLARALLEWQIELGATEAIGDAPIDRFAAPALATRARAAAPDPVAPPAAAADPLAAARGQAQALARAAVDLDDLAQRMQAFDGCDLKRGARSFVFADGLRGARVMVLGEGPGAEEDRQGKPFVGPAGQLLDRMFAAIGLSRDAPDPERALYISNAVPWKPPANREPTPEELDMMRPFVLRHVELAAPRVLVLMGNTPCQAVLGKRGITRLRGLWTRHGDLEVLPMTHPAYLLRNPEAKRDAWADLLSLRAKLEI